MTNETGITNGEIGVIRLKWFKENIVELCVVLIVIDGLGVITYSILTGMPPMESRILDLFVTITTLAVGWLFKSKTEA